VTQVAGIGAELCDCEVMAGESGAGPAPGRVHVIGPVCFDLVFSGLSGPPSPGTEVRAAYLGISPGGVANVAIALARLGLDVALSAVFADDAFGHYLWSSLLDEGVDLAYSVQVAGWNTPVTSSVAFAREREMVSYEEVLPVTAESLVPEGYRADAFVVSLAHADPAWLASLHRLAPLVFADVAWDDERLLSFRFLEDLAAVDVFMPNAAEALACTRCETIEQAAAKLASGGPLVVVKDGAAGSLAMAPGASEALRAPAVVVDALDTTGAGDVFDAGFVYGSLAGWPVAQRLRFANLCASESVKLIGGSLAAPCWHDLAAFWNKLDDEELKQDFSFLNAVIHNAPPRRRECRRSYPSLERLEAWGAGAR
jgi:sugar/nucleoside kinase (ribokinase family)